MIDEQGLPQGRKRTKRCARLAEGGEDDCGVCGVCKKRAKNSRSYHANPEKSREKSRESRRRSYHANPEKARAQNRRSYHANPEKSRESRRRRRHANPEKSRESRRRRYLANPEKVREESRRNAAKRGGYAPIADPEMEPQLRTVQGNTCASCLRFVDRLVLDHCHTTGLTRGLLCPPCNKGLGFFRDSPELLLRAVAYLKNPLADKLRKASA